MSETTAPAGWASTILARRVGPRAQQVPAGARSEGLAADSHLAGALLTLWHGVVTAGGSVGFAPDASRTEIAPAVTDAVNGLRAGRWFAVVLTEGGQLVGSCFLIPHPRPIQRHLGDVRTLMIDPAYRRRGLGRRLMDEVAQLAVELGVDTLLAGARDLPSLDTFYRSTGFVEYGRLPDGIRLPDGTRYDQLLYRADPSTVAMRTAPATT